MGKTDWLFRTGEWLRRPGAWELCSAVKYTIAFHVGNTVAAGRMLHDSRKGWALSLTTRQQLGRAESQACWALYRVPHDRLMGAG